MLNILCEFNYIPVVRIIITDISIVMISKNQMIMSTQHLTFDIIVCLFYSHIVVNISNFMLLSNM